MKILVLGGEGMLGHKMFQTLSARFPETACTVMGSLSDDSYSVIDILRTDRVIDNVNAMDLAALDRLLAEREPDVVVNCIGIIKQRDDSSLPIPSITLNSLLPHRLAEACSKWNGRLVHVSSDCVFNGLTGGYTEESPSDADDLYGRSKYLGEVIADNAITLRTSIIGRELFHFRSLLEWFLSQNGKTVRGYKRVFYSGVTTNLLSRVVGDVIEKHPDLSGLYQVTSNTIPKHDLLMLARDAFKLDVEILPDEEEFSDRSMVGEKFSRATGFVCPPWSDLLAELANDPTPYAKWRRPR